MTTEEKLKQNFKEINKAYFEREFGVDFLRVEVTHRKIEDVTLITEKISNYLDEIDKSDQKYYLDVFSPGTDEVIDIKELSNFINDNVYVSLKKSINGMNEFIGQLLSNENEIIIVRWNAKGQFRKQEIAIDNIEIIKKYAKVNKKSK